MGVCVRLAGRISRLVGMLVVFIVHVGMRVLRRLVNMMVLVMLAQVQPHTQAHQHTSQRQLTGKGLLQKCQGRDSAEKGRGREVGAGTRSAEMSQGENKQHEADAITEEADQSCEQGSCHAGYLPARNEAQREVDGPRNKTLDLYDL